jgi:ribosome silencing factor RsfS/YbeB/iojap
MAVKRAKPTKQSSTRKSTAGPVAFGKIAKPHADLAAPRKRAAKAARQPVARPAAARPAAKAAAKAAAKVAAPARRKKAAVTHAPRTLTQVVFAALADMKAVNIKALDVRGLSDVTDTMVLASGTSDRHVRSIADRVLERCKAAGFRPLGIEGQRDGEWVLLDLHDLILHVMLPRTREFYALERLWEGAGAAA